MATPASIKDLSKAINTYIQSPVLPLPEDLNRVIASYLEKNGKYDEAASARLQEELTSIHNKFVNGRTDKYGPFLAVLRAVRPVLRTRERIAVWWDKFIDPVLENLNVEKGLAHEALQNILQLVAFDDDDEDEKHSADGPNIFADRLLSRWMQLNALKQAATGSGSSDSKERFMQEAIMKFGKKDAKGFLIALNTYFVRKEYRNRCLNLLCEFVQSQPPHLHLVLETPLFENILKSLQHDDSTTTVSLGLVSLFMLLPNMPSSLVPYLPTLFNIYARLLFWDRSFAQEHAHWEAETKGAGDASWDKCLFDNDLDGDSIHHLSAYFTILYGLYPINFLDYIRKPQRYLRHANNAEDIDVQATEIRERSERFRRCHLLHPNFYQLTIESEKTDFSRWIKSEPAEVITDCMNLCIVSDAVSGAGAEGESSALLIQGTAVSPAEDDSNSGLGIPLLSSPITSGAPSSHRDSKSTDPRHTSIASATSTTDGTHADLTLARKTSQSSHPSTHASLEARPRDSGDSPTLPPHLIASPSHTQLQDMMAANKAIKTSLHQSLGNDSVPSLSLSHADSTAFDRPYLPLQGPPNPPHPHATTPAADLATQLAILQRQNLLLQNDLHFERHMKQQHMTHIGELRRRMLREAATEAETQNLVMANRSLKHQLGETKKAALRARKEGEARRAMAAEWEAQLSARLRRLRDEQRRWTAEENALKRELEGARAEAERLRALVRSAEARVLRAAQDGEALEVRGEEVRRLREEVARLAAVERRYQGREAEVRAAVEVAGGKEAGAEERLMEVRAREERFRREREGSEREVAELRARVAEAEAKVRRGRRGKGGEEEGERGGEGDDDDPAGAVFQAALANLQAKHAELQRQYGMLRRKYTVAQSSLLDLQCDIQEKKNRAERGSWGPAARDAERDGEGLAGPAQIVKSGSAGIGGPVGIRTRGQRGLSDPEATFEATSYNATAPLEPVAGAVAGRPSTPTRAAGPADERTSPHGERYYGRGGVQNSLRKEQKKGDGKKDDKADKKEKKTGGVIRNFRNLV